MTSRKPVLAIVVGVFFAGAVLAATGSLHHGEEPDHAKHATAEKKINLNTASLKELMTLPGIGETKAQRIINHRQHAGPFRKIEELLVIRGISRKIFEGIRQLITVGEVQPPAARDPS